MTLLHRPSTVILHTPLLWIFVILACSSTSFGYGIQDSIGVVVQNGKKVLVYKVEKETLFSIAKRYGVSVETIKSLNPELEQGLKIGQKILIPLPEKKLLPAGVKTHKVGVGETVYAITKKYNITADQLKTWNQLTGNELKIGSILIVSEASTEEPDPAPVTKNESPQPVNEKSIPISTTATSPSAESSNPEAGDEVKYIRCQAGVFDTEYGDTFYYASHPKLSPGSIVRVVNEATGMAIFCKVIEKNEDTQTPLKLSKRAYELLSKDKKTLTLKIEYFD